MKSQSQLLATDLSSPAAFVRRLFPAAPISSIAWLLLLLLAALATTTTSVQAATVAGHRANTIPAYNEAIGGMLVDQTTVPPAPKEKMPNFLSVRQLADGETDIRIHYRGITAKETSAMLTRTDRPTAASKSQVGMRLLQVTDGRHFVQAIYDAGYATLKDCEYVRDDEEVALFLAGFAEDVKAARTLSARTSAPANRSSGAGAATGIVTLRRPTRTDVSGPYKRLVDYRGVRAECKNLHRRMKLAKTLRKEEEESREAVADVDRRSKRELFIYPDTNWCGVGSTSDGFNDLGLNAAADRCCRQHDHCPYMIEGFTTKYNLFNYRFHTLSHCECDERFRTCLKMVDNSISNLVGKLFFNVVQMKCFVLKSEKTCVKRTWWGRCSKHDKQVTAQMKDALAY